MEKEDIILKYTENNKNSKKLCLNIAKIIGLIFVYFSFALILYFILYNIFNLRVLSKQFLGFLALFSIILTTISLASAEIFKSLEEKIDSFIRETEKITPLLNKINYQLNKYLNEEIINNIQYQNLRNDIIEMVNIFYKSVERKYVKEYVSLKRRARRVTISSIISIALGTLFGAFFITTCDTEGKSVLCSTNTFFVGIIPSTMFTAFFSWLLYVTVYVPSKISLHTPPTISELEKDIKKFLFRKIFGVQDQNQEL